MEYVLCHHRWFAIIAVRVRATSGDAYPATAATAATRVATLFTMPDPLPVVLMSTNVGLALIWIECPLQVLRYRWIIVVLVSMVIVSTLARISTKARRDDSVAAIKQDMDNLEPCIQSGIPRIRRSGAGCSRLNGVPHTCHERWQAELRGGGCDVL